MANANPPFVWKGKTIETGADLHEPLKNLKTKAEAKEFLETYARSVDELGTGMQIASHNLGYFIRYYDEKEYVRLRKLFGDLEHPVYG